MVIKGQDKTKHVKEGFDKSHKARKEKKKK